MFTPIARRKRRFHAAVPLVLALAGAACDVFDPELYLARGTVALADRCDREVTLVGSGESHFEVDTSQVSADYQEFYGCARRDLPGNDGFLKIKTGVGEKWHVHVDPLDPALDPAIYVLPACDARQCQRRMTTDGCDAGQAEHLSFVSSGGTVLVGLDSRQPGGGRYSVIVTRPTCGNGIQEHSEVCDDGNRLSGDSCDPLCRKELPGAWLAEEEPNEMPAEANVFTSPAALTLSGTLGDHCADVDVFALEVVTGGSVQVQLATRSGRCPGSNVQLALIASDGLTELGKVDSEADVCPALDGRHAFAQGLAGGTHYLRLSSSEPAPIEYQLKVERK
jgi:cysteine-rich repeat protein